MAASFHGKLFWYELQTPDAAAAETFYSAVVGWTVAVHPGSNPPYRLLHDGAGRGIAGMTTARAGESAHWVMYVGTEHVEDTAAHIQRLGGATVSPLVEMPGVGRMQTIRDPQGATFVLMTPGSPERPPDQEPGPGDVAWHELYTTGGAAAMTFYSEVFGWREIGQFDMGPAGTYYIFGRDFRLGGIMTKPPAIAQSYWGLYFRVGDVDRGAERVKTLGGHIANGPTEVPGGERIVQCVDPQGALFSLHQLKPEGR